MLSMRWRMGARCGPAPGVALVADQQLTAPRGPFEQLERDLALAAARISQGDGAGCAVGSGQEVQTEAPIPARVAAAVAVAGRLGERRALRRLAAAAALDWSRVDQEQVIPEPRALGGEHAHEPLYRVREAPAALPIGGLAGQVWEEVDEAFPCDRQEPAVAGDAHDRLGDAERDQLGIGDATPRVGSSLWQKVVSCAIDDGAESVEVGVHRGLRADGVLGTVGFGLSALLSLDRLNLVESII